MFLDSFLVYRYEAEHDELGAIPIVAMTAFTMPEDQAKCLQFGMNDYISKPFTKENLREMIAK